VINPSQIQKKAESSYAAFLGAVVRGEAYVAIECAVGAAPKDYIALRDAVLLLISKSKAQLGYGYRVDLESRKTQKYGQQSLPKRIYLETEQDFLKLIKKENEFLRFKADLSLILAEVPELYPWLCHNPMKIIEYGDRWNDLIKVCQYFQETPQPNLYIRELPIQIHTKFIEQNKGIIRSLLEAIIPPENLQSVEDEKENIFEKRFALKYREPLIRFRFLDETLKVKYGFPASDISIPLSEFRQFNLNGHRFFMTENLMNFLTLPDLGNSIALFGSGYAIQSLKSVQWLTDCPIFYWGDLDADGFKILSQLRSYFPQVVSILMDIKTFETFQSFAITVPESSAENLPCLTSEEQILYFALASLKQRLEQEHISQEFANQYFQALKAPHVFLPWEKP
jgi:hypothetical protein